MQTHVALVLALVASFDILPATPAAAATVTQAGITYETAGDGTATVTGFDGSSASVTIPDSITEAATEYLVIAIADHAFDGNALTSVTIGDEVRRVGRNAFWNSGITSLTLGSSVETIAWAAFEGTSLGDVVIPSSVTTIENYAFAGSGLTSVTIDGADTSIGYEAFARNPALASVDLGNGATTIGERAFQNLTNLTHLDLGGTTSIGYAAFEGTHLGNLTIPASVTAMGSYAFKDAGLTSVVIENAAFTIPAEAFFLNPDLAVVDLGNAVTGIGHHAFADASLSEVSVPGTVVSIGNFGFAGNVGLTTLSLAPGLETIGDGAFAYTDLREVTIPSTVTTIVDGAFLLSGLTSVTIDDAAVSIGRFAFGYNTIESLDLGSATVSIGARAFRNNALTTVTLPEQVSIVGPDAFDGNPLETVRVLGPLATYPGGSSYGPFGPGLDPLIQFSEEHRASGYTSPTVTLGGATYRSVGLITVSIKTNLTAEPTVLEVPSGWVLAAPSLVEDGYWLTSLSTIPAGIQVGETLTQSATITAELAPTAVSGAASAVRGEPYRVEVTGVPDGGRVAVELHSAPVDLGTHEVVDGAVTVTIPSDAEFGAHDLVVTGEQYGTAVGTVQLTVVEPLAETGPDGASRTMGLALVCVLMGVAALFGRRLRY
ncbi:leucine-rich repeat domain-containing protein [Demequina sp. NBRC 110052]|uniref:leucine-rich repeat domain-containing protein n=1 Tax=Demequina sp. NBRC 110052 TaxID=1570341 RepID=UPI00135667E5|nr:leucine-rich repeat domain-containing protein [Demequina sp. NBRC 110052]